MFTVTFALLIIRHPIFEDRFVLVDEGKRGWWLPGGGVDGPETFIEGGRREAMEEAGIEVQNIELLKVEASFQRLRYILTGKGIGEKLKTVPDKESQGARWMTFDETLNLSKNHYPVSNSKLRGSEPLEWFSYLLENGPSFAFEGFVDYHVELGTLGIDEGKRSVFITELQTIIACYIPEKDEFIVDPSSSSIIQLPRTQPKLEKETYLNSAVRYCQKNLNIDDDLLGILCLRDRRNSNNKLDFRVCYYVETKGTSLKTAKFEEFLDPFDRMAIQNALKKDIKPLNIVGTE